MKISFTSIPLGDGGTYVSEAKAERFAWIQAGSEKRKGGHCNTVFSLEDSRESLTSPDSLAPPEDGRILLCFPLSGNSLEALDLQVSPECLDMDMSTNFFSTCVWNILNCAHALPSYLHTCCCPRLVCETEKPNLSGKTCGTKSKPACPHAMLAQMICHQVHSGNILLAMLTATRLDPR